MARRWREKQIDALRLEAKSSGMQSDELTVTSENPDTLLLESEVEANYERALAELSPKRREAYLLCARDGLSYVDIAARMGISEEAARQNVSAGLRRLRRLRPEVTP